MICYKPASKVGAGKLETHHIDFITPDDGSWNTILCLKINTSITLETRQMQEEIPFKS